MARFRILSKDGKSVRYEGKPRYIGTYLKPSYLEFSEIASPAPIAWEVGDYVDYPRTGMRYRLYSIPQPSKNARKGSHGRAFTYSNVQLHAATKELEIALFRDLVSNDNNVHFSTSPDVATFEDVYGIVRRIQACMDDLYPGRWEIRVADFDSDADAEIIEKISTAKDFAMSGGTCLDALSKIYELWQDIGWMHSHENGKEVITIGYANRRIAENTTDPYIYGKGNGLTAIRKNQTNKDEFATRLYVYGSERNLPARYYNDKDILNAESVDIRNLMLPLDRWGKTDGLPDARKAYLENAEAVAKFGIIPKVHYFDSEDAGADIYPSIEGMTVGKVRQALADMGQTKYVPSVSIYPDSAERVDEIRSAVNPSDNGVIRKGGNEYKVTMVENVAEQVVSTNVAHAISIPLLTDHLYFAKTITADFSRGEITLDFGTEWRIPDADFKSVTATLTICDTDDPDYAYSRKDESFVAQKDENGVWIASPQKIKVEYDSHYDGGFPVYAFLTISAERTSNESGGTIDITLGAGELFIGVNEILDKTFHVTLKQIGFDINLQASLGKGKTVSMKTGSCAGRDFVIDACYYSKDGDFWALDLRRQKDKTLGMMFPNSDYPIAKGDRLVLLDIAMPEVYVRAAVMDVLSEGEKLLARASKIQTHYEPSIDAKVMIESGRSLREGMFMEITDEDVVDNTTDYILIDTLSIYEDESAIPTYKVTLRERRKVTYKGTPSATSSTDTESVSDDSEDMSDILTRLKNAERITSLFDVDEHGVYVTENRNFRSDGEISAGGAPTEEGESSGLGFDDLQWYLDQNKYVKEEDIAQLIPDNIATKDDVEERIAEVIAGAPEALDTLKEIADALAQNQDEIGAIFDAISKKASKEELKAVDDKHSASIAAINAKDSEQDQAIAGLVTKDEEQDREIGTIEERLAKAEQITSLFGEDEDGNVFVKNSKNFYTRGEISAGGAGTSGGGGGGSDVGGGYLDSLYDVELNEIAIDANLSAAEKEAVTESQVLGYDSKGLWVNKKTMYIHHQNESSTDWVIAHGMNKMPNVKVLDSTGELVYGTVTYNGFNEVRIHFSGSFSGKAYLD